MSRIGSRSRTRAPTDEEAGRKYGENHRTVTSIDEATVEPANFAAGT